jgi:hypothetical protein
MCLHLSGSGLKEEEKFKQENMLNFAFCHDRLGKAAARSQAETTSPIT